MFIISIFLLCFVVLILTLNRANTMIRGLALYYIVLSVMLLVSSTYFAKVSSYVYISNVDFWFYILLSRLPLPIRLLSTLYNIFFALYLSVGIYVTRYFVKLRWWEIILLFIPLFGFVIWNDAIILQGLNIKVMLSEPGENQTLKYFYDILPDLNNLILIIYTILPFVFAVKDLFCTKIHIKKQNSLLVIVFLILTNMFAYQTIFLTFGNIYMNNVNIAKIPKEPAVFKVSVIQLFILFLAMAVFIVILWYYNPFRHYVHLSYKDMERNNKRMSENAYASFHIYKNVFLSVAYQIDVVKKSIDAEKYEVAKTHISAIEKTIKQQVDELSKSLQKLGNIYNPYQNICLLDCLDDALAVVNIPNSISVKVICTKKIFVNGNPYHLKEVFVNLIKNAVEALRDIKDRQPKIEIAIFQEDGFAVIRITDNGCGLSKKDTKKIFSLFYTTKARKVNSGIGLSYVQNVVNLHLGSISVKSKIDSFTTFEIVLPCKEE